MREMSAEIIGQNISFQNGIATATVKIIFSGKEYSLEFPIDIHKLTSDEVKNQCQNAISQFGNFLSQQVVKYPYE